MIIHRIGSNLTVVLPEETISIDNCTDHLFKAVQEMKSNPEQVKNLLLPGYAAKVEEFEEKKEFVKCIKNSAVLTLKGDSVYMESISELTLPETLVSAILAAEASNDEGLLQSYVSFWTLVSLNPDSRVRTNLFWFLEKYGMTISKSGLFVAYRNVKLHKEGSEISAELAEFISAQYAKIKFIHRKSPKNYYIIRNNEGKLTCTQTYSDDADNLETLYRKLGDETAPVYTDNYSKTFRIQLGKVVTMDRAACDSVQENTCAPALHVAGKAWLEDQGDLFGNIGIKVLVNPADVVAVPPRDGYGKMRTCAYFPIEVVKKDEFGKIIDTTVENGFEDDFINLITYTGEINNVDDGNYALNIPTCVEINKRRILDRLDDIKYKRFTTKVEEAYDDEEEEDYFPEYDDDDHGECCYWN